MSNYNIPIVTQRFNLNLNIKKHIKSLQPNFGFNGLGEMVFRRTYSRNNESWADVVIRVIQGVMSVRKEHFYRNGLQWDDDEWQPFADKMALTLFNMEWLPPGRGLWMMGTDFTYQRGAAALNNCSATDTKHDLVHSAEWSMDCLMNGIGVGFSTDWRGSVNIPDKTDYETFIIPDSREGWVDSLTKLMCAYINSPKYGSNKFPHFDYSLIRPSGAPIKGFGGLSSGHEPLQKMHQRIETYLDAFAKNKLECESEVWKEHKEDSGESSWKSEKIMVSKAYSHTRLIADIFNAIGACVVAGNVRRSAEICLGDVEDEDFVNLKNYELNPERAEIGWLSNNSVVLSGKDNYEDFSYIPELARRIRDNGEPGMINLYNIQKFGRYGKELPDEATLVNPCFSGDTLIATADGRGCVRIDQLAQEGKDIPVYSMDEVSGNISIKWGRHPRITGFNQQLIRVHFSGPNKNEYLDVTPNHKFFLNDGTVVEAKDLKKGDSLPQFKKSLFHDNYIRIYTPSTKKYKVEHRMIAEFNDPNNFYSNYEKGIYNGCCLTHQVVVHHKDENKLNNDPDNLDITTAADHNRIHNKAYVGSGNPMYGRHHSEESKQLIAALVKKRCLDPAYRKKLSDAQTPEHRERARQTMTEWRKLYITKCYDDIEKDPRGLTMVRESPTCLKVSKICENSACSKNFLVPWAKHEGTFCSISCANTKRESIEARKQGLRKTYEGKAKDTFHKQAMIYQKLCENTEIVMKTEWEKACKEEGIPHRFNANSDNKWIASEWREFKRMVDLYNHQVDKIEYLPGNHTVYNITVDENHTLAVVTKSNDAISSLSGVFIRQCGEIPLTNFELCNLAEVFPPRCKNGDVFYQALRFATFYASTVSLLPTHRPETNAVVAKNRRIGVSISGVAQWASGEVDLEWGDMNYTKMTKFLRAGYKVVKEENIALAKLAGVPASVRVTTVKPSGSISLLAGVTAGVHYPVSRFAIRRVRIGQDSPLVPALQEANIPNEPDTFSENTLVFSFVVDHGKVRPCDEVSPWEQFSLVAAMQRCYADNCVSATIYFDKEKDGPEVEKMLAMYIPILKSVSMLPHAGHGYQQAPYEPITEEQYHKLKSAYTKPNFDKVTDNVPVGSKFCTGDTCEL